MHIRDSSMSGVSVCRSVGLSYAGIEPKLIIVGNCGFHRHLANRLQFFEIEFRTPGYRGTPLVRASNEIGVGKNGE